jgi:hypothetical protein
MCERESCPVIVGGKPLYFDRHHRSVVGAQMVVEENADQLK